MATTANARPSPSRSASDNPKPSVTQWIGRVKVSIDYSSPDVHGPGGEDRAGKIFGDGLVPYGLHHLGFDDCKAVPVACRRDEEHRVRGVARRADRRSELKAGSYGLHMIADAAEWTVIFSNDLTTSWGSYTYDPAEDALRIKVKPAPGEYREWLTYEFTDRMPDHATVAPAVSRSGSRLDRIKIQVENVDDLYVAQINASCGTARLLVGQLGGRARPSASTKRPTCRRPLVRGTGGRLGRNRDRELSARCHRSRGSSREQRSRRRRPQKTIARAMRPEEAGVLQLHTFGRGLQAQGEGWRSPVFQANASAIPTRGRSTWAGTRLRGHGRQEDGGYARKALPQAPDDWTAKTSRT